MVLVVDWWCGELFSLLVLVSDFILIIIGEKGWVVGVDWWFFLLIVDCRFKFDIFKLEFWCKFILLIFEGIIFLFLIFWLVEVFLKIW